MPEGQEWPSSWHPGCYFLSNGADQAQMLRSQQQVRQPAENVLPSEPSAMQVLLLCAHVVSHLVLASATPQATTAQQCPALEVTWSLGEAPSSKELW